MAGSVAAAELAPLAAAELAPLAAAELVCPVLGLVRDPGLAHWYHYWLDHY